MRLLRRGELGYDQARSAAVWNARKPDRCPDAIAFARDVADVVEALALARANGWTVGIRSGGHNFVGNAVRDGGLLLDLSAMTGVQVDAAARIAVVEPAADNESLIAELRSHGLTFTVGHCPSVALGGFLLGGGLGFNTGEWGYAAESVLGVDVITAAGTLVHADEDENPDLYWAARGGGPGFFGVVVAYHLRLRPHPNGLWSSSTTFPLRLLEPVTSWLDEVTPHLDPRVEPMGWLGRLAGHEIGNVGAGVPTPAVDEPVFLLNSLVFADSENEAKAILAPLEKTPFEADVVSRTSVSTTFGELFDFQRHLYRKGRRYAVDCHWTNDPPAAQPMTELAEAMRTAPSARTHALWQLPFGNYRGPQPDMAASVLGRYFVSIYAVWDDPADDDANVRWLRRTLGAFEPISTGHYAGDVDLLATATRAERTLSAPKWVRFCQIRRKWDPDGLFSRHLTPTGP